MPRVPFLGLGLLTLTLAGWRAADSAPAAIDYTIQVENTMPHEMDLFYTDNDSTDQLLGTLPGHLAVEYTIRSPARTSIILVLRGPAMPGYEARKRVELVADSVVSVVF